MAGERPCVLIVHGAVHHAATKRHRFCGCHALEKAWIALEPAPGRASVQAEWRANLLLHDVGEGQPRHALERGAHEDVAEITVERREAPRGQGP